MVLVKLQTCNNSYGYYYEEMVVIMEKFCIKFWYQLVLEKVGIEPAIHPGHLFQIWLPEPITTLTLLSVL